MLELKNKILQIKSTNKKIVNMITRSKLNQKFFDLKQEIIESTKFLDDNYTRGVTMTQRVYHILNETTIIPKCPVCNSDVLFRNGYGKNCSIKCIRKNTETNNKIKQTNIKKYGSPCSFQTEGRKNTLIERYGVDVPLKNKSINEKRIKTNIERYGVNNPMENIDVINKRKDTVHKNILKEPNYYNLINKKTLKTVNLKYEVDFPMQNMKIFNKTQKSLFKLKIYILPSGKEVKIQGYENRCLDELFKNGYIEKDIIISNKEIEDKIGKIIYTYKDKEHRYFPDIYIKSENKIIEVKSEYTSEFDKEVNLLKQKACLDNGLNFEFKIY